nr:hypothetical protein [Tanacetum cinerariifolium]
MLVLEARGIPLRFSEVQLSLVTFNPKLEVFYAFSDNQMSGPLVDDRSKNLLIFWWEVVQVTLKRLPRLHNKNLAGYVPVLAPSQSSLFLYSYFYPFLIFPKDFYSN